MMRPMTTPLVEPAELPGWISSDDLRPLPYCAYPTAKNVAQHVLQPLPASLPLEGVVTSPNGFLSDKDSGCMFYVIRLA